MFVKYSFFQMYGYYNFSFFFYFFDVKYRINKEENNNTHSVSCIKPV